MQLPAFITRALSFFDSAETKLEKLTAAQGELTELRARVTELTNKANASESRVATLTGENAKLQETVTAQASEIATLKASVETEKRKSTEVIASQGLPADRIPSGGQITHSEHAGKPDLSKMNETEQCLYFNSQRRK